MSKRKNADGSLQRIYDLFTSDLSFSEMERLVKRDAPGIFDFYLRDVERPEEHNPFIRTLNFLGNIFTAFLLKLTPARRIIYIFTLAIFTYSFFLSDWMWALICFAVLNFLLAFELADKLTAKDELEIAREIQMNLMPRQAPQCTDYDIACFSEAAREVGGDYYDFIRPQHLKDTTFIIIGDVSGKGMGAALHMVKVQALLQNLAEKHSTPRDLLVALNQNLQAVLRSGSFLTAGIASLNGNHSLKLCRAGHMPFLHFKQASGDCREILPAGLGLGLPDNGKFDSMLEQVEVKTETGDIVVFYTDGITEAMNMARQEYGEQRFKEIIQANRDLSANQIKDAILRSLAKFRGSAPPHDDLTLIVMKAI